MNRIRTNVIKISSPIFSTIQAVGCTSSLGWSFFFLLLMKTMDQWNGCETAVMSLRGVPYRKPFWWVIPKVFNLMCLLNTILTIQKWPWAASRAESSQWRAKEAAHVLDWLFLDAPYKSLILSFPDTVLLREIKLGHMLTFPPYSYPKWDSHTPWMVHLCKMGVSLFVLWSIFSLLFWGNPMFPQKNHFVFFLSESKEPMV